MLVSENIWKHILCYNNYQLENKSELKDFLWSSTLKNIINNLTQETIIVLWWDWTLLQAIHKHHKEQKQFLWVNFWTVGFLLNDKNFIKSNSNFIKKSFPLMEVKVETKNLCFQDVFFNEINITAWNWKMLELLLQLKDKKHITLKWDGMLISTPLWSTWYNTSLWWPLISHNSDVLSITPKACWDPKKLWSIIIKNDETFTITNSWRCYPIEIYTDGRSVTQSDQEVKIEVKKSIINIDLLIENNYQEKWENRIFEI